MITFFIDKDTNKITRVFGGGLPESYLKKELKENEYVKEFKNSKAYKSLDIRAVNDDGSIIPLSKQVELGYRDLADDEKLDVETIVKLTQEELEEKFPEQYPKEPEPTELEKLDQERKSLIYQYIHLKSFEQAEQELLGQTYSLLNSKEVSEINIIKQKFQECIAKIKELQNKS